MVISIFHRNIEMPILMVIQCRPIDSDIDNKLSKILQHLSDCLHDLRITGSIIVRCRLQFVKKNNLKPIKFTGCLF